MIDGDDRQIGRILTRRDVLALFGGSTAALLAACAAPSSRSTAPISSTSAPLATGGGPSAASGAPTALPSCIVRPALTEGPYFVDEKLDRSDIRADPTTGAARLGTPLALTFNVSRIAGGACSALQGAQVDVWHCDALGVYSDAADPSFNTKGQQFLRGYQRMDASGQARFTTIYPGWYRGRAVHIHFKIRTAAASGAVADFTSQLFFDEDVNGQVLAQPPYSQHPASGRLRNEGDGIYQGGGAKLLLKPVASGPGWVATFDIGLASSE